MKKISLTQNSKKGKATVLRTPISYSSRSMIVLITMVLLCCLPCAPQAMAQTRQEITGRVFDESGFPLPGVRIAVQGQDRQATVTDKDGCFKIDGMQKGKSVKLNFSYIGFVTKTMTATADEVLNVILEENSSEIDEVVITGYQVLDKRESASSVFSVKAEDIMIDNAMSVDQMLQGKIPGMAVMTTSGEPSSTPKIRIRGNATINGNKAPVWVVDGVIMETSVPFTASDLNSEDAPYLIGNAIAGINPQDIEAITVLKDASATAIYGVKAANGVIVVTTKRGKTGKPIISYTGSVAVNRYPSYSDFDRMDAGERMELSKEIASLGYRYPRIPSGDSYEGTLQRLYNKELTQQEFADRITFIKNRNTDWYKEIFRNAVNNSHNINVSGGGVKSDYYFSLGFNDNLGATEASHAKRLTALAKFNIKLNRHIDVSAKISYNTSNNYGYYPTVNPHMYAYQTSRTLAPYEADGSYALYSKGALNNYDYNFLKEQKLTGQKGQADTFDGVINLDVKLFDGLSYQGVFSYQNSNSTLRSWAEEESYAVAQIRRYNYHQYDETSDRFQDSALPFGGILDQSNINQKAYTVRNTLTYKRVFADVHSVHAMGGVEISSNKYQGVASTGYGWTPQFGERFMPVYTKRFIEEYVRRGLLNPTNTNRRTTIASYFGTFSYSYDYRYTINANIRSDGSNKFGSNPKYRWLPTWSVAGKWSIAKEKFMKDIGWINHLDIRSSYGIQGNIHDDSTPNLIVQVVDRDGVSQLDKSRIHSLPNPDLRWEKTKTWDIALDFSLLDSRVKGSFEIYNKRTKDLIHAKSVPSSNGRNTLFINSGKMTNSGFEGFVNADILCLKHFDWSVGVNFAHNHNKITRANDNIYSETEKVQMMLRGEMAIEGEPIGSMYSYHFAGLSHENGYPLFYTKDGRKVHIGEPELMELVNSGSIFPTLYGGFDTQFTYNKRLSLSVGFSYNLGGKKRLPNAFEDMNAVFDPLQNVSRELKNRWKKPGDELHTTIPTIYDRDVVSTFVKNEDLSAISPGSINYLYPTQLYNLSDERVISDNFLRLRSLAVSYMLPAKLNKKLHLQTSMVRLQATNLHVWANKRWRGLDPETPSASIPVLPTYTLTLNVSF